jgi:hypothetical protein
MRRSILLFPFLFFACSSAPAAASDETPSPLRASVSDSATLDVRGALEGTRATFQLRTDLGCARNVGLPAITSGKTFTLALDATNLEEALACVVDVEVDGEPADSIAVSPDAEVLDASPSLALDAFALVSTDLDPSGGRAVRITVLSSDPATRATLALGEDRHAGTIASDENESRILFEIPARTWARAVLDRSALHVDVVTHAGTRSIDIRPSARVEPLNS